MSIVDREPMIGIGEALEIAKRAIILPAGNDPAHYAERHIYDRVATAFSDRLAQEAIRLAGAERAAGVGGDCDAEPVADSVGHRTGQASLLAEAGAVLGVLGLPDTDAMRDQAAIFVEALRLYAHRGAERGEVWARSGVKGQTFHLLAKAERAFQQVMSGDLPNEDHYRDMINYAAFAMRLLRVAATHETWSDHLTLDGEWPWAS